MRAAVLVLVVAGCGDNAYPPGAPLAASPDVTIVAHADDDLLFMQPDLHEAVQQGDGVTNIYVTAGNGRGGLDVAERRQRGLMRAYGGIAGSDDWFCGTIDLAGHTALHCRLEEARMSLVFLGYPDGGKEGEERDSLARLWDGSLTSTTTIARDPARYDRAGLIAAIAAALDAMAPDVVRTLEVTSTHGRDHSDHQLVGALALIATAASQSNPRVISYRGYNTGFEAENLLEPLAARSAAALRRYHGSDDLSEAHQIWLRRRYAVATRPAATGLLRRGDRCVALAASGALRFGECAAAPTWVLAPDGTLRVGDRCVSLQAEQLTATATCTPDPARRFFLDDEGHLLLGTPPAPGAPAGQHLRCLVVADERPQVGLCGAAGATTWELSAAATAAPRPAGLARGGRAVRLGDLDGDGLADLCAIEAGSLACARGDGTGGFAAMTSRGALAVEPESLVIGDVDGDTLPDACGRDARGITCALAAASFVAAPWTMAFAHAGPADARDRSLALADANGDGTGEICGLATEGVICAYPGPSAVPAVRSAWPARDAALWPGDLDGDGHADWCAATASHVACGVAAHRELTSDGVPWSFSHGGVIDPGPRDTALGALADIDGDGLADLCDVRDRQITCARSQRRGFGPSMTIGSLPDGAQPTALWLGDLDGDEIADACVDDGPTIRCIRAR